MHSFKATDRKPVPLTPAGAAIVRATLAETRVGGDNVEVAFAVDELFAGAAVPADLSHDEMAFLLAVLRKQLFGPDQRADAAELLRSLRTVLDSFYQPEG